MPNVPTYVKSSDLDSYLAIRAKGKGAWSEFIHNALNQVELVDLPMAYNPEKKELRGKPIGDVLTTTPDKPIKTPKASEINEEAKELQRMTLEDMKAGTVTSTLETPPNITVIKSTKDAEKAVTGVSQFYKVMALLLLKKESAYKRVVNTRDRTRYT